MCWGLEAEYLENGWRQKLDYNGALQWAPGVSNGLMPDDVTWPYCRAPGAGGLTRIVFMFIPYEAKERFLPNIQVNELYYPMSRYLLLLDI